jgi:tRNA A-37 threonylcarbamoyl transferase component Bud32
LDKKLNDLLTSQTGSTRQCRLASSLTIQIHPVATIETVKQHLSDGRVRSLLSMAERDGDGSARDGRGDHSSDRSDDRDADRDRTERLREEARERWGRAEADLDSIASKLDAADPDVRAEAAWSLAELATDDPDRSWRLPVESKLAPLLADDDRWVRRGASWAVATIADEHPQRVRTALSEVIASLADDDALVRENGVLALAEVAREYPRAAEPALSRLADIVRNGEGVTRRYAAETLRRLVTRLEEDGFPETIEATPEIASVLSGDLGVVEVTDGEGDGPAVRVRNGVADSPEDESLGGEDSDVAGDDARGPPELIPALPETDLERADFDRLADFGDGPLTTAAKARVRTTSVGGQHVVVVLRTLRPDAGVDASRAETAFRAWASIDDHDHVAPVLARGSNPRPWLATEFLDGGSLRDALGTVGFERSVWYAHRISAAVCHAHARGVVHGALRPGAVGLSRTLGAWPVPKVGDWGLGDLLAEVREPPVPTAFAAPEHLAPDRFGGPDPATDVYQLGALCYALFTGRPPFVGGDAAAARKIRNRDRNPAPPSEHVQAVPADEEASAGSGVPADAGASAGAGAAPGGRVSEAVDDLLGRALATEKRARFETAEDLRRRLEVLARDLSLSFEL